MLFRLSLNVMFPSLQVKNFYFIKLAKNINLLKYFIIYYDPFVSIRLKSFIA